jgi:1A family penicillin-binding protein
MLRTRFRKFFLIGLAALAALIAIALAVLWFTLPPIDNLHARAAAPSTRIFDRNGRLLYEIIDPRVGHHNPLPLSAMPLRLQQAIIAVEDANFYSNPGVDIVGIARALWINLRGGEALAGGSTITQQLARILLLSEEERQQRTLLRKLRESLLAWQIAQRYSKQAVLTLYLNEVYFGNLAYGADAAARAYFGKSASALDLAECALLAGLPQSPVAYDPYNDPELAKQRQAIVLALMQRNGFITAAEAQHARQAKLSYAPAPYSIRAPHFVSYVRRWLENQFGTAMVTRGGLAVTTTLDLALNDAATGLIREKLRELAQPTANNPAHNANNAALVALHPRTGEILAMVGSPNFFDASISGAVNAALALRQPGSAIKPITYATAFATLPGFTAATPIIDVRTAFPTREGLPYVPVNYDQRYHGPISVRAALATSNNVAAVAVLHKVGLEAMLGQAKALGIRTLRDAQNYGLALTLGGGEVRLLELTSAFAVFANAGRRAEPFAVREVSNAQGEILFNLQPPFSNLSSPVLDPRIAWLITDILADNVARAPAFGEGSVLKLRRPAAVKTGTTQNWRDNWTVGYTPNLVTGVWLGNADGAPMQRISGVTGAGPIWHDFMEIAHRGLPATPFVQPDGLRAVRVCALSGLLPTPHCAHTRSEWFIEGTQPTQPDTWHLQVKVDAATNQPAHANTPRERVVEHVLLNLPPEARAWARNEGWPVAEETRDWSTEARDSGSRLQSLISILQPDPGAVYRISKAVPLAVQAIPLSAQVAAAATRVEFVLQSGEVIATFTQAPFSGVWPMRAGEYQIFVRATLPDGRVVQSQPVTIRVLQ